jgi:catechol 2,3-dioxygenase-like lactoylglutathione lyase family enzyme
MDGPLPIESLNHIARVTQDLKASTVFYRDVLGFRPIWRPNFGFDGAWLYNYGIQIHLIVATGDPAIDAPETSIRASHVAFHVSDTDQVEELLKKHGIRYKVNTVPDTGVNQLFFQDPDGFHIEIGTYPPDRESDAA